MKCILVVLDLYLQILSVWRDVSEFLLLLVNSLHWFDIFLVVETQCHAFSLLFVLQYWSGIGLLRILSLYAEFEIRLFACHCLFSTSVLPNPVIYELFQWRLSCQRENLMTICICFILYCLGRKQRWSTLYRLCCFYHLRMCKPFNIIAIAYCFAGTQFKEKHRPVFWLCVDWKWGIVG